MKTKEERLDIALSKSKYAREAARWASGLNPAANAPYHNVAHMESVAILVAEAAEFEGCSSADAEALVLAALFHDFDHSAGHQSDAENIKKAVNGFQAFRETFSDFPPGLNEQVERLIRCTQYPYLAEPADLLEMIMRDADLMQITEDNWAHLIFHGLFDEMRISRPQMSAENFLAGCSKFYANTVFHSNWGLSKKAQFDLLSQARCLLVAQTNKHDEAILATPPTSLVRALAKLGEYRYWAESCWDYPASMGVVDLKDVFVATTGFSGETGEIVEAIIAMLSNTESREISKEAAMKELQLEMGDGLYYWAILMTMLKLSVNSQKVFYCIADEITKPGVKLTLNMARNDVLVSQCPVWKKIKPYIVATAEKERPANKRLSPEELESIAMSAISGDCPVASLATTKLVTYVNGKSETLGNFVQQVGTFTRASLVCSAPKADKAAVQLHERKMACVVSNETLERFGALGVEEFVEQVKAIFARFESVNYVPLVGKWFYLQKQNSVLAAKSLPQRERGTGITLQDMEKAQKENQAERIVSVTNDFEYASRNLTFEHRLITPKTDADKLLLRYVQLVTSLGGEIVADQIGEPWKFRKALIGDSEVAQAWTDGDTWIAYQHALVKNLSKGFGAWVGLLNLSIHEYLHNTSDLDSHIHDEVFMERYHECVLGEKYAHHLNLLVGMYGRFMADCRKKDIKVLKSGLLSADSLGIDIGEWELRVNAHTPDISVTAEN